MKTAYSDAFLHKAYQFSHAASNRRGGGGGEGGGEGGGDWSEGGSISDNMPLRGLGLDGRPRKGNNGSTSPVGAGLPATTTPTKTTTTTKTTDTTSTVSLQRNSIIRRLGYSDEGAGWMSGRDREKEKGVGGGGGFGGRGGGEEEGGGGGGGEFGVVGGGNGEEERQRSKVEIGIALGNALGRAFAAAGVGEL